MKQYFYIFFGLILLTVNVNAQSDNDSLWIKGNVKVLVGQELFEPEFAQIFIKQHNLLEVTDTNGNFTFSNLMVGKYKLEVSGFGHESLDTLITLTDKSVESLNLIMIADCEINKTIAERDIDKNKPRLLLASGIVPTVYNNQHKFERKYKVSYYEYGCVAPAHECMVQYNRIIFEYLDKKFGKDWRKDVREDIVGYKKWKRQIWK